MTDETKTIESCRSFLNKSKAEVDSILADKQIKSWQSIDLSRFKPVMDALNLPPELQKARDTYKGKAESLYYKLERIENDVGHLEADLIQYGKIPSASKWKIETAEKGCNALQDPLNDLREDARMLHQADAALRDNLSIFKLLPLGRYFAKYKNHFDQGLKIYRLVTPEESEKSELMNIHDLFLESTKMEARLGRIDLSELPNLTATIIRQQINISLETIQEIKNYIDHAKELLGNNLAPIEKTREQLEAIKHQSLQELLESITAAGEAIAKFISTYYHQAMILEQLEFVSKMLMDLMMFWFTVKKHLVSELKQELEDPGSALNIKKQAEKSSNVYFSGIKGVARMFKMFFYSFSGSGVVSEEELKEKLVDSLENCSIFYGNEAHDVERLGSFINSYIDSYAKPFPYDSLFHLMKKNITAYGTRVENYIYGFEAIPFSNEDLDSGFPFDTSSGQKTSLGNLIKKFEVRIETLKKYQK